MGTCLVFRHVAFEDLGIASDLLADRGFAVTTCDIGVDMPNEEKAQQADLLVVLGGPIGVYEEDTYPVLASELGLIKRRLDLMRPTLGICLGAQLMAKALGSFVGPGPTKEIGWAPIELTATGHSSPLRLLKDIPVLHWHGDNLALPPSADLLAFTEACPCQAFSVGRNLLGLQFHLELHPACIERWLIGHAVELAKAGVDTRTIRAGTLENGARLAAVGRRVLEEWLVALVI